jgi:hypothetical protein
LRLESFVEAVVEMFSHINADVAGNGAASRGRA